MTLVGNMPRFFVDSVSGNTISIRGNDAYHIGRSLRMRLGDIITVCADRVEYRAKILSISDKEVVCDVLSAEKSSCGAEIAAFSSCFSDMLFFSIRN